tara:strand:- start:281 stop:1258 length:978 start_codon:yes stop_codon:yes gene_type:complete
MNYKLMQRPMFRLGGNVRQNYSNGTTFKDIEKLINERTALREKAIGGIRSALPLQVLASQMPDIRTIRKPGDILNILSNIGGSQELIGALTKLPSLDLKMKEGELSDKISLAKLKQSRDKKFEFEKRLGLAEGKRKQAAQILGGKSFDQLSKEEQKAYNRLQTDINFLLRGTSLEDYLLSAKTKMGNLFDEDEERKFYNRIKGQLGQDQLAEGGRVGFQEGTPDPTLPQPKPKEPMDDRKVENLMRAAPALENPGEVKQMAMKDEDVFAALRRRLPQEITDDVVRLIAYNPEAFADFADISDQSDVDSFNEKYNVQLVLPVENVT